MRAESALPGRRCRRRSRGRTGVQSRRTANISHNWLLHERAEDTCTSNHASASISYSKHNNGWSAPYETCVCLLECACSPWIHTSRRTWRHSGFCVDIRSRRTLKTGQRGRCLPCRVPAAHTHTFQHRPNVETKRVCVCVYLTGCSGLSQVRQLVT